MARIKNTNVLYVARGRAKHGEKLARSNTFLTRTADLHIFLSLYDCNVALSQARPGGAGLEASLAEASPGWAEPGARIGQDRTGHDRTGDDRTELTRNLKCLSFAFFHVLLVSYLRS